MKKLNLFLIITILLVVVALGCTLFPTDEKATGQTDQLVDETQIVIDPDVKVAQTIAPLDENHTDTVSEVEELVDLGSDAIPALLDSLEQENDPHKDWAAIYVLSRVGYEEDQETKDEIIEELKKEYDNEAESIRIMAAGTAVVFGDKSGIPILIEGLQNREQLLLTEPPQLICQYAYETLSYYTDTTYGTICDWDSIDSTVYVNWKAWWTNNEGDVTWNETTKRYVI